MSQTQDTAPAQDELAAEMATGLRSLAVLIESNPELAEDLKYAMQNGLLATPMYSAGVSDQRARLALWARAAKALCARVTKQQRDDEFLLHLVFGAVRVRVLADRDQVCERVVTGTETVTKTVQDPVLLAEVPLVEVTEVVETVEWVCSPILADATPSAVAVA